MKFLKPGKKFGKWRLVNYLDDGGNGIVWKTNPKAAIKFSKYSSGERYERFKDEVAGLAKCQDVPGVIRLLDKNLPEKPTESNPPYLVMDLAKPVFKMVDESTNLVSVVKMCASFAQTLSVLHSRGVSHRDIKPANLFHNGERWMIGDFGLVDFPEKYQITGNAKKLGPMFYIAPEMLNDPANADGRLADVYSLAKTLWVLATGQRYPFPGEHAVDFAPMRISTFTADQNAGSLDHLLNRATKIDPSKRLSMAEFVDELRGWLQPAKASESGADLSDLQGYVAGVLGEVNVKRSQEFDAKMSGERLLEYIYQNYLKVFEEELAKLSLKITSSTATKNATMLRLCPSDNRVPIEERLWSGGGAFAIQYKRNDLNELVESDCFWCAMGVDVSIRGTASMVVGYAISKFQRGKPEKKYVFWLDSADFVIDGPKEKSAMDGLGLGLRDNLRPAIKTFLESFPNG